MVPSVHPTVCFLFLSLLDFDPRKIYHLLNLACGILAFLGPRNVYKDMLNNMVSLIDHVVMNHQNQTRTNGVWGHVRYNLSWHHLLANHEFFSWLQLTPTLASISLMHWWLLKWWLKAWESAGSIINIFFSIDGWCRRNDIFLVHTTNCELQVTSSYPNCPAKPKLNVCYLPWVVWTP
jgi:hypothetical protein